MLPILPPMSKLILGAPDAITARFCCERLGAQYIWASSFVMSSMLGLRDEGMINIDNFISLLKGIVSGATKPVLLDFDVGGKSIDEFRRNLESLQSLKLGGVCIEDENWPKKNAMLSGAQRTLASSLLMTEKIKMAKRLMGPDSLVVARTHSLIAKESVSALQNRVKNYQAAGADVLCVHYTDNDWKWYKRRIDGLSVKIPLLLILSNFNFSPKSLPDFDYVLFPNQVYRIMLYPILNKLESVAPGRMLSFRKCEIIETKALFGIVEDIYETH